jgi:CRISPR-associated protein Csm3
MGTFKLKAIHVIRGSIVVKTGLHIGAGNDRIEIGGMDNPIIRNPADNMPYIPGSSIKGKMRSLLEIAYDKVAVNQGKPCSCGNPHCPVCRVFGTAIDKRKDDEAMERGPTRIIVRDAMISEESKHKFKSAIVEEKNENNLNRITAEATPRPVERVVPGVSFDFEIVYRVFDIKNDDGETDESFFKSTVLGGLALLQKDYLGGGGSRGSGRIVFVGLKDETGAEVLLPDPEVVLEV